MSAERIVRMGNYVIDTNVLVIVEDISNANWLECAEACTQILNKIEEHGRILLDNRWFILGEYIRNLTHNGQPGLGNAFLKWIFENQGNDSFCRFLSITPNGPGDDAFLEFPSDSELSTFDRADRKFVAVALASNLNPYILNATDSDWWDHRNALESNGLRIIFLCPYLFR